MQALRGSLKSDSRVLKILEKEVEWLQGEQRQLEAHLSRTETWGENLGKWRAVVQSADVCFILSLKSANTYHGLCIVDT